MEDIYQILIVGNFYFNFLDSYYDVEEMENTSIKRDLLKIKKEMEREENEDDQIVHKDYKNLYKN